MYSQAESKQACMNLDRSLLRDDQWARIAEMLPRKVTDCGQTAADNRLFVEAVLYILRTGSPFEASWPTRVSMQQAYRFHAWASPEVCAVSRGDDRGGRLP